MRSDPQFRGTYIYSETQRKVDVLWQLHISYTNLSVGAEFGRGTGRDVLVLFNLWYECSERVQTRQGAPLLLQSTKDGALLKNSKLPAQARRSLSSILQTPNAWCSFRGTSTRAAGFTKNICSAQSSDWLACTVENMGKCTRSHKSAIILTKWRVNWDIETISFLKVRKPSKRLQPVATNPGVLAQFYLMFKMRSPLRDKVHDVSFVFVRVEILWSFLRPCPTEQIWTNQTSLSTCT